MPKKNIPLLKRLRTRFLRMRHPEHFNTKNVAVKTECGAAMCFAGHTLELAGYKRKYLGDFAGDIGDYIWYTPSGRKVPNAMNAAQRLLGLTWEEAQSQPTDEYKDNGLFLRFDLKTPKQAAKVIEALIKRQRNGGKGIAVEC